MNLEAGAIAHHRYEIVGQELVLGPCLEPAPGVQLLLRERGQSLPLIVQEEHEVAIRRLGFRLTVLVQRRCRTLQETIRVERDAGQLHLVTVLEHPKITLAEAEDHRVAGVGHPNVEEHLRDRGLAGECGGRIVLLGKGEAGKA